MQRTRRYLLPCLLCLIAPFAAPLAPAHDMTQYVSQTIVLLEPERTQLTVIFGIGGLAHAFDLKEVTEETVYPAQLTPGLNAIEAYMHERIQVLLDGEPVTIAPGTLMDHEAHGQRAREALTADLVRDMFDAGYTDHDLGPLDLRYTFDAPPALDAAALTLRLELFDRFTQYHRNIAKLVAPDRVQTAVFQVNAPQRDFPLDAPASLLSQTLHFTWMGVEHIFIGYDHILFLFALIIIGGRIIDLIKIVTAFTIAHSITLALATLEIVTLNEQLVECAIAASIAYVAIENFYIKKPNYRWIVTFIFGLVHGFGFANVLIELGLPTQGLVVSLLAFNVGVEIGQVAIVLILAPFVFWLNRQSYRWQVTYALSSVVLLFGVAWFIDRALELDFMPI